MISIVVIVLPASKSFILTKVAPPHNTPISKPYKQIWNTVFVKTWRFFIFLLKLLTSGGIRRFLLKSQQLVPVVFVLLLPGFDFGGQTAGQVVAESFEAVEDGTMRCCSGREGRGICRLRINEEFKSPLAPCFRESSSRYWLATQ